MTNQGIDDTMDTSEMLNQMVQMQMIQSMVNMTDATTMNYAASLVGKEVTVGKYNGTELEELVGTVTATGTKDGQHIIFINDEYYYLNEIMAVGRLPKPKDEEDGEGDGEGEDGTGDVTQKPDDTQKPDGDQKPDGVNPGGGTEGSNNGTGDGTTQDTNG
jgi:flagellar basal-body rod modification protein FlgD